MTTPVMEAVLDKVFGAEGGLSNHAKDRGGLTNYGLTKPFLRDVTGRDWSDEDVRGLTPARARSIARLWMQMKRLDQLPDHPGLAWDVVDFAFLCGHRPAIRALQRYMGVAQDGIPGPETQGRWHLLTEGELEQARRHVQASWNERIGWLITADPSQAVFAHEWLNRIAEHIRG
jgi:lysozyme family protein